MRDIKLTLPYSPQLTICRVPSIETSNMLPASYNLHSLQRIAKNLFRNAEFRMLPHFFRPQYWVIRVLNLILENQQTNNQNNVKWGWGQLFFLSKSSGLFESISIIQAGWVKTIITYVPGDEHHWTPLNTHLWMQVWCGIFPRFKIF